MTLEWLQRTIETKISVMALTFIALSSTGSSLPETLHSFRFASRIFLRHLYTLDIGDADGIVQGSKFTVHRKYVASEEPELCTAFSTTLVLDELAATGGLLKRIYAKQIGWMAQQGCKGAALPIQ